LRIRQALFEKSFRQAKNKGRQILLAIFFDVSRGFPQILPVWGKLFQNSPGNAA
jgi:hypothetical protein